MKIIKTFWNDLLNQSRFHFGCKYVFPILTAFLTWGSVVNIFESTLDKEQLVQNKGQVSDIDIVFQQGARSTYKYYPLFISLNDFKSDFRLRDALNDWFPLLQDKIHVGDTITVYTRTKLYSKIGWGESNDIYLIEKNNEPILPAFAVADYNSKQGKILLIMALVCWAPFILYKFKIINPK
jgi:hypothetical protein